MIRDFTITLEDKDLTGHYGKERVGRKELQEIVDILDLQDTFRVLHTEKQQFTYTNTGHNRAARLDRAYVPSGTPIYKHENLECTTTFTDHKGILIDIGNSTMRDESHTGGVPPWKFNDSLLEDEQFKEVIKQTIQHARLDDNNIIKKMSNLRKIIKLIAQDFGKIKKMETNIEIKEIETILMYAPSLRKNNPQEYHKLTDRLEELKTIGYKGAQIRSRLPNINDKPSKKFIHLEASKQNSKMIGTIIDKGGNTITDKSKTAAAIREFYKKSI